MAGVIISAVVALLTTAAVVAGVRRFGPGRLLPDHPGARRKAVPCGAPVVLVTTVVLLVGTPLGLPEPGVRVRCLLAAACVIAVLGQVHDVKPVGPVPRLVVTGVASVIVAATSGLSPVIALLAALLITLLTNGFALLEGSDGATGTVAVVTGLGLFVCALVDGSTGPLVLLVVLVAALGGFLVRNWQPAHAALGECGALFAGFLLAGSAVLLLAQAPDGNAAWTALPLFLLVALADVVLVAASRRRAGRPLLVPAPDHLVHRLRRLRLTQRGTAVALAAVAALGGLSAVLIHTGVLHPLTGFVPAVAVAVAVAGLLRVPVHGPAQAGTGTRGRPFPPPAAGRRRTAPPAPAGTRRKTAPVPAGTRRKTAPVPSSIGLPSPATGARRPVQATVTHRPVRAPGTDSDVSVGGAPRVGARRAAPGPARPSAAPARPSAAPNVAGAGTTGKGDAPTRAAEVRGAEVHGARTRGAEPSGTETGGTWTGCAAVTSGAGKTRAVARESGAASGAVTSGAARAASVPGGSARVAAVAGSARVAAGARGTARTAAGTKTAAGTETAGTTGAEESGKAAAGTGRRAAPKAPAASTAAAVPVGRADAGATDMTGEVPATDARAQGSDATEGGTATEKAAKPRTAPKSRKPQKAPRPGTTRSPRPLSVPEPSRNTSGQSSPGAGGGGQTPAPRTAPLRAAAADRPEADLTSGRH